MDVRGDDVLDVGDDEAIAQLRLGRVQLEDSLAGGITGGNYGATVGETDDVDGTFNDGVLVLSVLITGGGGTNVFDSATGEFLRGTSTLIGEVTFALEDFFFFTDGQDINDLIASLIQLKREGWRPERDVIVVLTGDGEHGHGELLKLAPQRFLGTGPGQLQAPGQAFRRVAAALVEEPDLRRQ